MHLLTVGYKLNGKQLTNVYKNTTLSMIRTIDPQFWKQFLHLTHITTGALPVSVANSSYSLRTLITI